MSTDSLINNIDYNTKMDENISIVSNDDTILPEDLSYSINIIENQQNSSKLQDEIKLLENKLLRMKYLLIIKIIFFVIIFCVGLLCILFYNYTFTAKNIFIPHIIFKYTIIFFSPNLVLMFSMYA